jgi:hypothetical protein
MINKYATADKSKLKEYQAIKIQHKETKNGKPFTMFTIADSKKNDDNTWNNEYYTVFVWKCLNIEDKDKITFDDILAIEIKEDEYNGNKSIKRTIFADVSVVGKTEITEPPILDSTELPF